MPDTPELDDFIEEARRWLVDHAKPRREQAIDDPDWGVGEFDVSVFHNLSHDEERALIDEARAWQRLKHDAGYGALSWPVELGGAGLPQEYDRAFRHVEAAFERPRGHEILGVTLHLIAPTIAAFGTAEQQERFVRLFLRADDLCCQLFSEPGAGSDLAALSCRADRDGDHWVLNGQKVWSSGAQFAAWGEAICRHDPTVPKHRGLTAFLVPMDAPGVEVRPIRQMSGGTSFNEVFLTDVRLPDTLRLGEVGDGWRVAITTLGFERGSSGDGESSVGGSWRQVLALAHWLGATADPTIRQALAGLYTHHRLQRLNAERVAGATRAGGTPGPEGSIGKLLWTQGMARTTAVVSSLLGPRLLADTGEWGSYGWVDHVLGAPGYRIAGGSDEVQRNIIGERVLGLPGEPRVDRDIPFTDIPRGG